MPPSRIPDFPDRRPIELEDKQFIDRVMSLNQPFISAYTFTNLWAWRGAHNAHIAKFMDAIILSYVEDSGTLYLEPLPTGPSGAQPNFIIERMLTIDPSLKFGFLSSQTDVRFRYNSKYSSKLDLDNCDYMYPSHNLIELPGRLFDAKRNFINGLKNLTGYTYEKLTPSVSTECYELVVRWDAKRIAEGNAGLSKEQQALCNILHNYEVLNLVGGVIRIHGEIVAFSIGEQLNRTTLVVHVEKAAPDIRGIYQLINNEFCKHEASKYLSVNREQDLGIEGLRKAKISYHPSHQISTYRLEKL